MHIRDMLIGYARVSTDDQNLDLQRDALQRAGCTRVFEEKESGREGTKCPTLEAALTSLRPEDQLVVWKVDRLGRSLREMLDTAHASAWHWSFAGAALEKARATMLLAEVHALLGMAPSALRYAEEMREFFLREGAPDWEIAFVHAIHAHAAAIAGRREAHAESHALAAAALGAIADEEERAIVAKTFEHVPAP